MSRKHAKWGERPMAFVVIHPDHASKWKGHHEDFEKDLKAYAKKRLPGFACPEWVEVVSELPVSRFITLCSMLKFFYRKHPPVKYSRQSCE